MGNQKNNFTVSTIIIAFTMLFVSCQKDSSEVYDHKQSVGASHKDLILDDTYKSLIVEIQYPEGFEPTQQTIDNLLTLIDQTTTKSKGITVHKKKISMGVGSDYSIQAIKDIEDTRRDYITRGDTLAIYFLFLNDDYEGNQGNSKVLGVAYRNTSMALFEKTIHDLSGGFGQPDQWLLESSVTNHEFGHILGLVNNHLPMETNHQDHDNGHHCDNEDCLMYWLAETGGFVNNLIGVSQVPSLDQNCLNDLQAIE